MKSATHWRTVELSFDSERRYDNPYLDVEAVATLSGPGDRVIRRPAFWDGERTWRVRFAPPEAGIWRVSIASNDPFDDGLNRDGGELVCRAAIGDLAFFEHGFLRASTDGRHLVHADGAPFFWLGDTHWRFTHERWGESNKPGWSCQFRGMVDRRVEQGFTVYQTNVMSFGSEPGARSCWIDGREFEELDVSYMRSVLDPRMAYIADSGLLNAVGLAWYPAIDGNVSGMVRFARYMVARYGSFPVAWTLGGEVAGYDPDRRQSRIDGWRQVALAIRDADDYQHPRAAHLTAERPLADYYQGEEWLTFTLNQHGHGDFDLSPSHYTHHLHTHPGTPLVEGESLYEGLTSVESAGRRIVTDTMVRQAAYRAVQSGCCGYTYGAQGCWNGAWDNVDGSSAWGDMPWHAGVDLPGADQLGAMRRFYESVDWTSLHPDADCFGTDNVFNSAIYPPAVTADADRRTVVAFFGETYRLGDGTALLVGPCPRPYRLRWFDPRLGRFVAIIDGVCSAQGVLSLPDKPDAADWLLVAEAIV
jgi:hypothetical protein